MGRGRPAAAPAGRGRLRRAPRAPSRPVLLAPRGPAARFDSDRRAGAYRTAAPLAAAPTGPGRCWGGKGRRQHPACPRQSRGEGPELVRWAGNRYRLSRYELGIG